MHGVLVLTERGEHVYVNHLASQVCDRLLENKFQPNAVPVDIWRICQALIDSRKSYPDRLFVIETEITPDESIAFLIRVRWFQMEEADSPYILVTLEEQYQSTQSLAIAEAQKYGLTPRQAEIWVLRRANYTYKEIAAKLFITLNTVKKHVKNIRAKQEMAHFFSPAKRETYHIQTLPSMISFN